MTQKEKAKAYDEALERARKLYNSEETSADVEIACETIFPELAESEDERIRKWIIDDIRYNMDNEPLNNSEYKKEAEKAISWLEKQSKQKSVEWTELDEECFQHSLLAIRTSLFYTEDDRNELVNWFKSIKQRMNASGKP